MQVGQLQLQSFYEERESPPGPAESDAAADGLTGAQPKELLDSLPTGDDAEAGASSHRRRVTLALSLMFFSRAEIGASWTACWAPSSNCGFCAEGHTDPCIRDSWPGNRMTKLCPT